MKFAFILMLFVAVSALNAVAQNNDYGKIEEIRGMTKVYVSANAGDREAIIKQVEGKHGLIVVGEMEDAEFYLNFQEHSQNKVGQMNLATGQLDAYLRKGERLRTVWFKEATDGAFKNAVATSLAKKFIKDFGKLKE